MLHKKLYFALLGWGMIAIFYSYQYFLQVSPGVMANELMRDLNIHATALGVLAACYLYTYAGMQIPVGIIIDRYGARKPLTSAICICACGAILFGTSSNFALMALGRLMIGFGGAFAVISGLYLSANSLPIKYFAFLTGLVVTLGMFGASFGQSPLATMINSLGWRYTMILFGGIGLIIAVAVWLMVRDAHEILAITRKQRSILYGLRHVLKNRQIWLLAIYGGLVFMPISVFGSLWGVPFLMVKYQLSNTDASIGLINLFMGLAIGCPVFGWLSDYIKRRKVIMFYTNIGALISVIITIYLSIPYWLTSITLFMFGLFTGGFLVSFAAAREIDESKSTGANMGFMNTMNMIGGAALQPLCGWILDLTWQGPMNHSVRIYTTRNFQIALAVIPLAIILATIMLIWVKETFCREVEP